jgi:large subunit ribosomal protein L13
MQRQTTLVKPAEAAKKIWYLVDANEKPLGRLASEVAMLLMGKNKPTYTPNVDTGDYVIVINAKKVGLSGDKLRNKKYYNVSTFNGGLRTRTTEEMLDKYPEEMFRRVVWGMLPKGRLGRQMIKKLFVYAGADHDNGSQQPIVYEPRYLGGNK